jgi:signal transduction histidine kinase
MFKKLRNKFLFLNMAITSLVVLTAFSVIYITTYINTNRELDRKLENVAGSFVISDPSFSKLPGIGMTVIDPSDSSDTVISNKVTSEYSPSFIIIVDKNGKVFDINSFIDMPNDLYLEAASTAWQKKDNSSIIIEGHSWKYRVTPLQTAHILESEPEQVSSTEYFQISFLDITDTQKNLNNLLFTFLFVGLGTLAVVFLVSIYYANRSMQPIEESWKKQKQFVADASHELKTPLTEIILNCGALKANEDETVKSQAEWVGNIQTGADRMSKLVNGLLLLARSENVSVQTEKQPFDMAMLVHDVIQSLETAAQFKKLSITRDIKFEDDVCGYEELVRQVLSVLYDNAVKYSNQDGQIEISARRAKKYVICKMKNTGKGIAEKDLPHIFERFYRADASRENNNDENSYGLGLSIAKRVAEQIGGKIAVKSKENEWTEFTFIFEI